MRSAPGTPRRKAILLVTHEHSTGNASLRYRSLHQAEALRLLGVACDVTRHGDPRLLRTLEDYECVVLHRFPWDAAAPVERRARELGMLVVSNTDDLVFEPSVTEDIEAIVDMSEAWRTSWAESYRRTVEACHGGAIVATEPLRARASSLARPVEVVPNVVSEELVRLSEHARRARELAGEGRSADEGVAIAYLSGSLTHRRDFAEASAAVLRVLETHPRSRFVVVGPLQLDPRFERFAARVERIPRRPWEDLPVLLARVDLNLAPLADNPFSECKSCVKYLEAALVGVPTIASARADFTRVIEHGRNGLLARSEAEWIDGISSLVEDGERRRELGSEAHADVHRSHTTRALGPALERAWTRLARSRGRSADRLAVDWLVGDRRGRPADDLTTIVRLADGLAGRGHRSRVYLTAGTDEEAAALHREHEQLTATIEAGTHSLAPADVRIATDTATAYLLDEQEDVLFRLRLVQRPGEAGFELPLRHVCLDTGLAARVSGLARRPVDTLSEAQGSADELERLLLRACFLRLSERPRRSVVDWRRLGSRLAPRRLLGRRAD